MAPIWKRSALLRESSTVVRFNLITAHTFHLPLLRREVRALNQMPCGTLDPFLPVASLTFLYYFHSTFTLSLSLSLIFSPYLCWGRIKHLQLQRNVTYENCKSWQPSVIEQQGALHHIISSTAPTPYIFKWALVIRGLVVRVQSIIKIKKKKKKIAQTSKMQT